MQVPFCSLSPDKFICQCFLCLPRCLSHSGSLSLAMSKMKQKTTHQSEKISPMRFLPSVDALINSATAKLLSAQIGSKELTEMARQTVENLRSKLRAGQAEEFSKETLMLQAESILQQHFEKTKRQELRRVINATGVVIHTNLGRAPLALQARQAVAETASGYCTLEYDVETGKRGLRGRQTEELLCDITGAESALVVNNCAAAAFLVLSALSSGGEAIVSRGELVEIGGDFRVPDVMAQSGTTLVEVGTTNRTKVSDFAGAITEKTKLIVRVHPSNFRIVGFTAMPEIEELANLARAYNLLLYEDAGSGALVDLSEFGLADEPVVADSIKAGADIVTFSGDKLLGGVQSGLIVGKLEAIEKLRQHPLYRALRVDKTVYAALAATLKIYRRETHFIEIPVLNMISMSAKVIEARARDFVEKARQLKLCHLTFETIEGISAVGGGSAPLTRLPTVLIALKSDRLSAAELESHLRFAAPPIITRTAKDRVLLDLRTVFESEEDEILAALQALEAVVASQN